MAADRITSVKNPLVQKLKSLQNRRGRVQTGLFLVEGGTMIAEAVKCGLEPVVLIALEDVADSVSGIVSGDGLDVYEVSEGVLASVCDTVTPQGCACAFKVPEELSRDGAGFPNMIVALDSVQDPGNVGTIWRTADAAGFQMIIAGDGSADMLSPKVQRAAMGSGFRLPYKCERNLPGLLDELKRLGYDIVVSSLSGEPFYSREKLGDKFVLVIGSEAHGVSSAVDGIATKRLKLPMRGGAESLNAAVAAGIMLYELTREIF